MIPTPYHFRGVDREAGLHSDVRAEIEAARSRARCWQRQSRIVLNAGYFVGLECFGLRRRASLPNRLSLTKALALAEVFLSPGQVPKRRGQNSSALGEA